MKHQVKDHSDIFSSYEKADQDRIKEAITWAEKLHSPNEAAFSRPLGMAAILAELKLDADTVIAAILHETPEAAWSPAGAPAGLPREAVAAAITERFGKNVAFLVEGAARIASISATNKTIQEAENIRKMLFAMVRDIRVIFIKLADKLTALRELDHDANSDAASCKTAAQECLDIYAPLADRLGISWMKDELEDLSLKYLNREAFSQIKEIVSLKRDERQKYLDTVKDLIKKEAASSGITIDVESRAKHFYSIYQKMRKRNKGAEDLYDLFGLRILCDNIEQCYTLLGLVHRLWKPLEGRFKDYIAMPKANGYQSLHTTVMVPSDQDNGANAESQPALGQPVLGQPFPWSPLVAKYGFGQPLEIQIRTFGMHQIAEYGVASHWLYKKGSTSEVIRPRDVSIINRLKDWKRAAELPDKNNIPGSGNTGPDSESFLEDIKRELLKDSIYAFTPQGKVIELPAGASPIDFAYAIHTAVGDHCSGAKADGAIIPLSSELQNTQVVEILTTTNARPHINWLRIVKTAKARNKIRSWLQQNDSSVIIEKNVVAKKKDGGQSAPGKTPGRGTSAPHTSAAFSGPAGKAQETASQTAPETFVQRVPGESMSTEALHVRVEDEKNMMIRFAKCCNPVMGDSIVGYVSRGRGIIVHRKNCRNLINIPDFAERRIDTEWENAASLLVKRFKIEARLHANLFSEIEGAIRKYQGHLIEGRLEQTRANHLTGFFTMQLEQQDDLRKIMKNIRGIPVVFSIMELEGNER
ncbi:MAG: HD domain-containing protein [Treponema sp.]|jgi:GTP pyrophosphokinase|nr:HD domain-containing protein [Treponema sp.]